MADEREYFHTLEFLYSKSLILHDTTQFHPVLWFFFLDSLAHIDYTAGILAFNYQSPKNVMAAEYLRWRIDEEKKGERALFPGFVCWLRDEHPAIFQSLPELWKRIYSPDDPASYRSFRIVLSPDSNEALPSSVLMRFITEFFSKAVLMSLYDDSDLSGLFRQYKQNNNPSGRG
jgi:hypothetical protein